MLETLKTPAPDKILQLMGLFTADPRDDKVDLGVGVYKDAQGKTPIMRAVKAAERRLWEEQQSKSYVGLLGDPTFTEALRDLVFGDAVAEDRVAAAQTPGGTGAVRQLFEFARRASPEATFWLSEPTWPNHAAILKHLGYPVRMYRYFDRETLGVDFDGMIEDLRGAARGDVVLVHGCCHNPTGANLDLDQWKALTELVNENGLLPMVDLAYQGFGDGLDADVAGLRYMAANTPEMLLAASCSKNFGVYRDRVGVAFAVGDPANTAVVKGNLAALNRSNYSFPPDHGAKVVSIVLNDPDLRTDWMNELESMRLRMLDLRQSLTDALRRETNSDRFDFIAHHRGMFSLLGLEPDQVVKMREDHGVYIIGDSRINIAGLPAEGLERIARGMVSVQG